MFAYGETVGVLTAGTSTDDYGNTVTDWDAATEVPVDGVGVEPRPLGESDVDARNSVTSGFTLYMPAGTVVKASNRVRVRGTVWDVDGDPAVWRSPFTGWEPGVVVQCRRVDG